MKTHVAPQRSALSLHQLILQFDDLALLPGPEPGSEEVRPRGANDRPAARRRRAPAADRRDPPSSFLSECARGVIDPLTGNRSVFAARDIEVGELIAVFGGVAVTAGELSRRGDELVRLTLQVEDDTFLLSTREGPADWINHSCEPNAGLRGQVVLVAMRPIVAGEEICFDYAMSDGSSYDEFECHCGAASCRGRVSGEDWQRSELWRRYAGFFSPYLQRRIDGLKRVARRPRRRSAVLRLQPELSGGG